MSRHTSRCAGLLAAAVTLAAALPLNAAIIQWTSNNSGSWNTISNWTPVGLPGASSDVQIGPAAGAQNESVSLSTSTTVASVLVNDGMSLSVNGALLTVTGDTTLTGQNSIGNLLYPSRLSVNGGGGLAKHFSTQNLTVALGGGVLMNDSATIEVLGQLTLDSHPDGSNFFAEGTVNLKQNLPNTAALVNDGVIQPRTGTVPLVINQLGASLLDLDGATGTGRLALSVSSGTPGNVARLIINGTSLADTFDGELGLAGGNELQMNLTSAWTLAGDTRISSGNDSPARITGAPIIMQGAVDVWSGTIAHIEVPATLGSGLNVTMGKNVTFKFTDPTNVQGGTWVADENSSIEFLASTTVSGGTFTTFSNIHTQGNVEFHGPSTWRGAVTVNGVARVFSNATVTEDTVINADVFDPDADSLPVTWTLQHSDLTLNVGHLSQGLGDYTGADFIINHLGGSPAYLTVNLANPNAKWQHLGNMTVNGHPGDTYGTVGLGSDMILNGLYTINTGAFFYSRFELTELPNHLSTILINNGGLFRFFGGGLNNPNLIVGGTVLGPGEFQTVHDTALHGHGYIQAPVRFFGDTSELRADNGLLQIAGQIIDMGVIGTADTDGILDILNPWSTNVTHRVHLMGGELRGDPITNNGVNGIAGFGSVTARVDNRTRLAAEGGTLIVANMLTDWDGANGLGTLEAISGDLTLIGQGEGSFDGTAKIGNGHVLFIVGFPLDFAPASDLFMSGGTLKSDAIQTLAGRFELTKNPASFETQAVFLPTSVNFVDQRLNLRQNTEIRAGAAFTGAGDLTNNSTGILTLRDGVNIGVLLRILGTTLLEENAVGHASTDLDVDMFGQIIFDLDGNKQDLYDRLVVGKTFTIRGEVEVHLLTYNPVAGDEFDILDFAVFVNAGYTLDLPALSPGLSWDTSDFEPQGILRVVPEPTTAALLAASAVGLLRRRRNRG